MHWIAPLVLVLAAAHALWAAQRMWTRMGTRWDTPLSRADYTRGRDIQVSFDPKKTCLKCKHKFTFSEGIRKRK